MIFNTHSHINDFEENVQELIDKALYNNVNKICAVGYDVNSSIKALEMANKYEQIYAICGIQPEEISSFDGNYDPIIDCLNNKRCVALGEIGLDYYHGTESKEKQMQIFEEQLKIAINYKKPIVIHTREAANDTFSILAKYQDKLDGIIMHCYTGSVEMMKRYLKEFSCPVYFSIGGIVTFKNAKTIKDVAKECPIERLLVETDDPYLTPSPYRGQKNEPGYVIYVVSEIAKIKNMTYDEIAKATYENAMKVFHL